MQVQHVLRCWLRQSDGSEYKKNLRRPGIRPDPAKGTYSAPANPLVGGEGRAAPPQEPHPPLSALRVSPVLSRTPKLVPTPLTERLNCTHTHNLLRSRRRSFHYSRMPSPSSPIFSTWLSDSKGAFQLINRHIILNIWYRFFLVFFCFLFAFPENTIG